MNDALPSGIIADDLLLSHVRGSLRSDAWLLSVQALLTRDRVRAGCSETARNVRVVLQRLADKADSRHLDDGPLDAEHDVLVLCCCRWWYHA